MVRHGRHWSLLAALALALVVSLLNLSQSDAHAFLVRTTPQAGERLDSAPQSIDLRFSEPVVGTEPVTVTTADGAPVETGPLERLENGLVARAPLPRLGAGVYVVSWRTVGQDGHFSVGEFAFAIGSGGQIPASATRSSGAIGWLDSLASWLFLAGLLLAFGGLASERFIWVPVAQRHGVAIPRPPIGWLLLLALLGATLQILLLIGRPVGVEDVPAGWPRWLAPLATRPGLLALFEVALVAYGLWLLAMRSTRRWVLLPLGLALAAAAARGHLGTTEQWWAAFANVAHLGAAGFWGGALGHLLLVAWRLRGTERHAALGDGVRRYAESALVLVVLVLASGLIMTLAQFSTPLELVSTTYGRVLLVKLLLVAAALALAYAARRGGLSGNLGPRLGRLRRLTRAEGIALLGVFAAASVLANTAPPWSVSATEDLIGPPPLAGPVLRLAGQTGWLAVYLAAAEDQLQVRVLPPGGEPQPGTRITVEGRAPDGTSFDLTPRRCGAGCFTTAFPWQSGTTTFAVTATSADWDGGTIEFSVLWPPTPEDPELLERVIETMRAQREFTLTERVTSGPGASSENTVRWSGERFVEQAIYASGGATGIRSVPAPGDSRALTLYIPGSSMWFRLEIDAEGRLRRETIVNSGHLIERTFAYDVAGMGR